MKSEKHYVITVGREYGSGGREIGKRIAADLGIAFYDKELLYLAAKESGLSPELFDSADEQATNKLAYALSSGFSFCGTPFSSCFSNDTLFNIQSEAMRNLVEKESCVIVGRCADFVLRENPRCINVFVHAPEKVRIERVMLRESLCRQEALELITKTDKNRANYYNYYSHKEWGKSASYHFSLDSSLFGIEKTAEIIEQLVTEKLGF
ncbi:MAG: cytidylate kinase-like family protein [Bacteroidales bacterium]|nr:cytidylate kinase-like family protein [Bacteroidales bacterium]